MGVKVFVLLLTAVTYVEFVNAKNYCKISSCQGRQHTACIFKLKDKPKCNKLLDVGLTQSEKNKIVDLHNRLRKKVADGKESAGQPGPQPGAKNMTNLKWNDEIAEIAQIWANQCKFQHDECRDIKRSVVGQNLAIMGTTGDVNSISVDSLIHLWYDEVKFFDKNEVQKPFRKGSNKDGKVVGHYTQFVWGTTNAVGCGAVKYNDGKFNQYLLVCNYGPAGNIIGQKMYDPR